MNILKYLRPANLRGANVPKRIIVIESDDWGNEGIKDNDLYEYSLKHGKISESPYYKYDCLESNDDLEVLFNTLLDFKDKNGNPPVITGNYVSANPNYKNILLSEYEEYSFIPTKTTYESDYKRDKVIQKYHDAISKGIFMPQYHGREHLDVGRWMKALKNNDERTIFGLQNNFINITPETKSKKRRNLSAAFDFDDFAFHNNFRQIIIDMAELFNDTFGFWSKSFIAPAYTWHSNLEIYLKEIGVEYIQGTRKQTIPVPHKIKKYGYVNHSLGEQNDLGQIYLIRNCFFEPTLYNSVDNVAECLKRIEAAFCRNKPAIIASHRLNFIGGRSKSNRENTLNRLKLLLKIILKKWPDIEFMSSDQLGELLKKDILSGNAN